MMKLAKFLVRGLLRLLYRVEVSGMENYSLAGNRVLIVANHTSLLDGLLLYAWLPETPTFAINTQIARKKQFRFFLRFVDLFMMDPTNPLSIKSMIKYIKEDRKAVIFPEGRITITGALMKIYEGPALVADKTKASVLPIAIDGPQFSPFSYMQGRGTIKRFPKIKLTVLPPEKISAPSNVQGSERRKIVSLQLQDLMYKLIYSSFNYRTSIFDALLHAANRYGKHRKIINDIKQEELTYKQIITRSVILGDYFRKIIDRDEHTGLLLPNVSGTVIVFMAMQYVGRIPAMLNYTSGVMAMLQSCETAKIRRVMTSRNFIENAGLESLVSSLEEKLEVVYLEDLKENINLFAKITGFYHALRARHFHRKYAGPINPDHRAVILFTSGSEGAPKGVVLSHSNLLSNYAQVSCHIDFNPSDILFSCLPLFHSFGLNAGALMPLLGGSKIFFYPTPLHYRVIPELVYELGITIFFGTNTFFKGYAKHAHPFDFNSVRYVVAGAEKLKEDTMELWREKFGIRVLQGYGVTEASPVISVNTPMMNRKHTVGRLLTDMECHIQPVEGIDKGGKLLVRGPNIMLGYLIHGSDKLKEPKSEKGPGWYDTGDIVDIDEEGFITILGRAKRFAKIGGEMISLTAVEELALKTWPKFNHAAVNLPDEKKGEKIVLMTDNPSATRRSIQDTAHQLGIGELNIPKKVIVIDKLPVLGTGKTDYQTILDIAIEDDKGSVIDKLSRFVKH